MPIVQGLRSDRDRELVLGLELELFGERGDDGRVELRPGTPLSSTSASTWVSRPRYTRSDVIASYASTTKMIRAPSGISFPG